MKTMTVEKKESLFKRFINMLSKSALFDILANSTSGVSQDIEEGKEDAYSAAFKQAYKNQESAIKSLSTLEEDSKDAKKSADNPWKAEIDESSELTSKELTDKNKSKSDKEREISD